MKLDNPDVHSHKSGQSRILVQFFCFSVIQFRDRQPFSFVSCHTSHVNLTHDHPLQTRRFKRTDFEKKFRSILLDSDELTDSMNNKFVMAAAQKWLRDLLLMLDLGKLKFST